MPIYLPIDESLLEEAHKAGDLGTVEDTVNEALREFIQRRKEAKILELFGTIDFDPSDDYKSRRTRT